MSAGLTVHPSSVPCAGGATVWLTGLPSAGKSTIAAGVAERLRTTRCGVEILDGDVIRTNLSKGLGFSREDRAVNIRRIGFVSGLLARNGVVVLVAAIAPHAEVRDQVRADHDEHGVPYVEVHVSTPVEVTSERDVKGLYAKHRAGEITGLTGVDDEYEVPQHPDVVLPTHEQSVDESVEALVEHLAALGVVDLGDGERTQPHPALRDAARRTA
ncbi:adenylyl-sulfate kinase [Actinomycetospora atypica]|uniref:Adenylyl-sulfate kinase n=1 Tax=Actinomycetospora atypica TaxID=1290095 RepID=A0ABV9YG51_9PSEU